MKLTSRFFSKTKKLILGLALGASILSVTPEIEAANIYVTNVVTSLTNLVIAGPAKVFSIQLLPGSTNLLQASLYDNKYSNIIYTNQAYATLTNYSTNVISQYISPLTGMTNNMTNVMIVVATNNVAASTNNLLYPQGTWAAAASTAPIFYLNAAGPLGAVNGGVFAQGVVLTLSTNGGAIIVYRSGD